MSTTVTARLTPGTWVKTSKPNPELTKEWTEQAQKQRTWDVFGKIIAHHDSHGLCYDVLHLNNTVGCYDPSEFAIVTKSVVLEKYPTAHIHDDGDAVYIKIKKSVTSTCDHCGQEWTRLEVQGEAIGSGGTADLAWQNACESILTQGK